MGKLVPNTAQAVNHWVHRRSSASGSGFRVSVALPFRKQQSQIISTVSPLTKQWYKQL